MIRILIISGEPVYAEGVRDILAEADFEVAGLCRNLDQVRLYCAAGGRAGLVFVTSASTIPAELVSALRELLPDASLVLSTDRSAAGNALQAIELGVRGVVSRKLEAEELIEALRAVAEGEMYVQYPAITALPARTRTSLTAREGELLKLVACGLKNKEIATAMRITEGSVKTYMFRLFRRLNVKDRFELAMYAMENPEDVPGNAGETARLLEKLN